NFTSVRSSVTATRRILAGMERTLMDVFKLTGTLVRAIAVLAGGLMLFGPPRVVQAAGCATVNFEAVTNFGMANNPLSVAVGDFNGDGVLGLATANASGSVAVRLGTATGSFGAAMNFPAGTTPGSVAVGDFNGDGKLDLAVANEGSDNVSILLGTGTGSFGA